ncbi:MAG: class I SAM-dependent methyltransferase [Bacteroidia bacterium]
MNPENKDYLTINQELWDKKTKAHVQSDFYNLQDILDGESSLIGPDASLLNDLEGKDLIHLQCHFGLDSLSLARKGAKVLGLDFSSEAIKQARALYKDIDVELNFVVSDVYSATENTDKKFDVVYTSYGTIGWLPDVNKWAKTIANLLKDGGKLIFAEFHPVVWMFDDAFSKIEYSYFNKEDITIVSEGTYADKNASINSPEISWNHPLDEVFQALMDNGLHISSFKEYDYSPYACFDPIVKVAENRFQIKGMEGKIPMMYTIVAQKLS